MFNQMHYDENYNGAKQATNPSATSYSRSWCGCWLPFRHMDLNLKTRYFADFASGTDKASSRYAYKPVGSDTSAWDLAMSADFYL